MEFDITGTLEKIDFGATGIKEILQNVKTILTTMKYSVPLDRNFGITGKALDQPTPVAQAILTAEIVGAINKYEPRVRVTKVSYDAELDGKLVPKVRVIIND